MKKLALYLAGLLATIALAPEASALPVFARQTGMACSACHFQHFPMLKAFGRAFKSSGFTMMGGGEKVEGDNLSIPAELNAAILATAGYVKTNATSTSGDPTITVPNDGSIYVPGSNGEFSLFVGGRVSDSVGALAEIGLISPAGVGSAKIPMLYKLNDDARAGLVLFTTDGQGASYGFETLNTGANAVHTMLFVGGDANGSIAPALSAQQYIGTATAATGAAFVVNSPNGFINVTKFHQSGPGQTDTFTGANMSSTYLRAVGTFDLAGWDMGVGIQNWSGQSSDAGSLEDPPVAAQFTTKATAVDFQMQGAAGEMPLGIYASYATAPAETVYANVYNGGPETKSSFNISAELGVVPERVTVGAGIRMGKSGQAYNGSSNATDNALLLEASYKLAQNQMLNLYYTKQSGDYWDSANADALGSSQIALNLAILF
jgi:hypothetical protein